MKAKVWRLTDEQRDMAGANHALAITYAKNHHNDYGLRFDDALEWAYMGLCRAVYSFEPERGFRLSTYARFWMRLYLQIGAKERRVIRGPYRDPDRVKCQYLEGDDGLESHDHPTLELNEEAEALLSVLGGKTLEMVREIMDGARQVDLARKHNLSKKAIDQRIRPAMERLLRVAKRRAI